MSDYIKPNLDDLDENGIPHKSPLPPTSDVFESHLNRSDSHSIHGEHVHHWVESDEGHPDGQVTAICHCGYGITYYPGVHKIEYGKIVNG